MRRFAFLHSRISGYFQACIEQLALTTNCEILIVLLRPSADAPFSIRHQSRLPIRVIYLDDNSGLKKPSLQELLVDFRPDTIVISGWWNPTYLRIATHFRKAGLPVVMCLDTQWVGTIKQRLKLAIIRRRISNAATHAWVPGRPQWRVADFLGLSPSRILSGYYTCDSNRFRQCEYKVSKKRQFIFVGRAVKEKGISHLLSAYQTYRSQSVDPWELLCVGTGPMSHEIKSSPNVSYQEFVQPEQLPSLLHNSSAFIIASIFEPWGVAIHEAAATGLPLICTDRCGAAAHLLYPGYNGIMVAAENDGHLVEAMLSMSGMSDASLRDWGERSRVLASEINVERWVATILSVK